MVRDGKPKGFFYLDHRTVDGKHNIITDTHVTAANIHDSLPYLKRLDEQRKMFGFKTDSVGLDAGYFTPPICKGLEDRELFAVIGYKRQPHRKGFFHKRDYKYIPEEDFYLCPEHQILCYSTTNREGYRVYVSNPDVCRDCPSRHKCTESKNHQKVVTRHVWDDCKDRVNRNRLTPEGKRLYQRRKETIERSFADAKQLHGLRYARFKGLRKTQAQCFLTAAAMNMKKMALAVCRGDVE